jgi:hypothetical protein
MVDEDRLDTVENTGLGPLQQSEGEARAVARKSATTGSAG